MAKPELQRPYRKKYFDPLYKSVYGEEFPGLQSDLLSNKARFITAGKKDYPGLKIWTHANAAAVLRDRIKTVDNIIKGKFGGTLPAWLKESGGKNPGGNNPGVKAGQSKKYGNPFQSSSGKSGNNPGSKEDGEDEWEPTWWQKHFWDFCKPFPHPAIAMINRSANRWWLLPGIRSRFSKKPKIAELWEMYLGEGRQLGGTEETLDLSDDFAGNFMTSEVTKNTTRYFVEAIKEYMLSKDSYAYHPESWPGEGKTCKLDLAKTLPDAVEEINKKGSKWAMDWKFGEDIPGDLVGGMEKRVARYGAYPSLKPDTREAAGDLIITRVDRKTIAIVPSIEYTVKDTLDLCPGDPGGFLARLGATILLSQYEASGISGDVPFFVKFKPEWVPRITVETARLEAGQKGGEEFESKKRVEQPVDGATSLGRIKRLFKEQKSGLPEGGRMNPKGNNPGNAGPSFSNLLGGAFGLLGGKKNPLGGNPANPGPNENLVKPPANPGNPGVNPLGALPSGKSLGWSEEEVARRAVALAAAPAATPGRPEVGGSPASAGTTRNVTFYQTVDNVTINTGGPLDAQALRGALERYMRSEAQAVA